jgi:hypothetical protein
MILQAQTTSQADPEDTAIDEDIVKTLSYEAVYST